MSAPPERELTRSERAAIRRLVTSLCANYDCQDKLCLPLDCPCYMLNKWWTGAFCRYFRAAVLPTEPKLESALTGEDLSGRRYARSAERLTFRSQARRIVRIFAVALPDGNPSGNGNGAGGKTEGDVSAT